MSGMFWIALKLSIPKMGLIIKLSLLVKELASFKCNGVVKSGASSHSRGELNSGNTQIEENP